MVSGLSALDAEITLSAGAIATGPLKLGQTQAGVTLDRARAVVKLTEAAAYGGGVTGQFVLNGRQGLKFAQEVERRRRAHAAEHAKLKAHASDPSSSV